MIKDILHLKAPGNWINDPNGFIYYHGKYHLFYQHFPCAPVWGTMHWGHAVSEDLIHWEHLGIALFPTKSYDRDGVFSGSALEKDGQMYLYYSGVRYLEDNDDNIHAAKDDKFETSQVMIISEDGMHFDNWEGKKQIIPVIRDDEIADATHTRDPKVWKYKDTYYMVLGSTFCGKTGRVLFYKSQDAVNWEYVNQYRNDKYGNILECPDIFRIGDSYVFMGSPMNIMRNIPAYPHQTICTLAGFREESCELELPEKYQLVDYGFDLYASQTNLDSKGRRVMLAWMRMPGAVETDSSRIWNGMMCLPRVVEVDSGHIYFRLHPEVDKYMSKVSEDVIDFQRPFRIKTALETGQLLDIGGYRIWVEDDCLKTDRSQVFPGSEENHVRCSTPVLKGRYDLDIFVEPNLIEIFVNDGEYVISNVVYELGNEIDGPVDRVLTGRE